MSNELLPQAMTVVLDPDSVSLDESGRVRLVRAKVSDVLVHHTTERFKLADLNLFCPGNWKCGRTEGEK